MRVLLIIPAYNEEENIKRTIQNIWVEQEKVRDDFTLDYIVINDGSTDHTRQICQKEGINCLTLVQNLGIGGAVQTGYRYARYFDYDIAVQFDGDGQHDIASLKDIIEPIINEESDFVVGSRFVQSRSGFQSTFMRRVGIKFLSGMIKLVTGTKIYDVTSGYRAASKSVIAYLAEHYPTDYPEPESLVEIYKKGFRISEKSANMFERVGGTSSINALKSVYYMIKVSVAILFTAAKK